MFEFNQKGNFEGLTRYLVKANEAAKLPDLEAFAQEAVEALSADTPKRTGLTAASWHYKIEHNNGIYKVIFLNSNIQEGVCIALVLQYGNGTGWGGWVEGRDYINPAIQPVFDKAVSKLWREVTAV